MQAIPSPSNRKSGTADDPTPASAHRVQTGTDPRSASRPAPEAGIEHAEARLSERDIDRALALYAELAPTSTSPDRISGGRWMCHMLRGDYTSAWLESDAIRGRGAPDPHRFWNGGSVDGKRVLVRCLRGYGDTVMYLRWLPLLRDRARQVLVQASPEILPLLHAIPGDHRLLTWNPPGETDLHLWDVQVESAELPYLFRATTATLPPPTHFDLPEAALHRVRTRLGQAAKPRVGIVWTGSNYDAARSIPFDLLRPLLSNRGVEFWSLQAPSDNAPWVAYTRGQGWNARTFYGTGGHAAAPGLADLAAFVSGMDLVVTIDTLAAHLAGSLGLPTWVLLKREADWRWMLHRCDSPWYPTLRLFRQATTGDWTSPLEQVCSQLRDWCEEIEA